jgi:hypothetical protein
VTADGGSTPPYSPSGGPFVPSPGPPLPPQPGFTSAGARSRSSGIAIALATVAVVLAAAALIVSVVRGGQSPAPATPTAQPSTSPTAASDTSAADKALCESIAPLMTESDRTSNEYTNTGDAGTPARDAALPKFIADTEAWIPRIQTVLDAHPDVRPLFKRSLQRYIDDRQLLVWNVEPGPSRSYDESTWADSLAAYGGPLRICHDLGVHW